MSPAQHCRVCASSPTWTIKRIGDGAWSWSCPDHLSPVCAMMQRDGELTQLIVTLARKLLLDDLEKVTETMHA